MPIVVITVTKLICDGCKAEKETFQRIKPSSQQKIDGWWTNSCTVLCDVCFNKMPVAK